ncbi:unnamed protein product, partial [Mesorhabditis belari]|uniref:Uncharacterized protein n=1 Tax=Mesorhabditis belari TaxID=2138241 RepID=A0AAF3J4Y7_9BILA
MLTILLISFASISQVKAILNCTGASPGPCNNGLCTIVQASGLVCTSGGCCDNTEVISIETGATTFNCANDESSGPLIPGVPCPSDSVKAFDSTGELLCCPLANLIPITPTTVKTYTAKSDFWLSPLYVEDDGYAVDNGELYIGVRLSVMLMGYFGHFFPFAALFLDLWIFVKLIYMRVNRKGTGAGLFAEINLFIICVTTFLVQFSMMIYLDNSFKLFNSPEMALLSLTIAVDLFTLSEAYIGLAFNRRLRRKLLRMLFAQSTIAYEMQSAFQSRKKDQTHLSHVNVKM